jgi:hypothetical protein
MVFKSQHPEVASPASIMGQNSLGCNSLRLVAPDVTTHDTQGVVQNGIS